MLQSNEYFVLYVDDDAANLAVFRAIFAQELRVLTVSTAAEALTAMRTHQVAVLLTDQRMPGMTGVELATIAAEEFPDTLRYLVTAYADHDAAAAAINSGQVRRYLRKPWDVEELRATLLEALEHYRANRRIRELESRTTELERMYTLGVVSASIAHELRNPLTGLSTHLDLAYHLMEAEQQEQPTRTKLQTVERCLQQARDFTTHLADVVRAMELNSRGGDVIGETRSCDPAEVVDLTLKLAHANLRSRVVEVEQRIDDFIPHARCSATGLSQVLLNLLTNAADALPAERDRADNRIRIELRSSGGRIVLTVEDNGSGIPEDVRRRMFDPFFTTKGDSGTGLGLAISRKIVEDVGGTLTCTNLPAGGTSFTLTVPVAESHQRSNTGIIETGSNAGRKQTA